MLVLKTSSFMIASVAALLARHSACGVGRLFSDLSFGTLSFGTLANKKSCQNTICYCSGFLKRPKPDRDQLDQSLKSMARMAFAGAPCVKPGTEFRRSLFWNWRKTGP